MSLDTILKEKLQQQPITFQQFMQMALYDPKYGYYTCKSNIFGNRGDFITAPEISSLFSRTLAHQCYEILQETNGNILEFGAGTGKMAATIMQELSHLDHLPNKYQIIEYSPKLIEQQKSTILSMCPKLINRFEWVAELPGDTFQGIIIANEVLDAMPIHRFNLNSKIQEYYVNVKNDKFVWHLDKISDSSFEPILRDIIHKHVLENQDYDIEYNFYLDIWLKKIYEYINSGSILVIDYGFPASEYYHPSRDKGTIMCHYQHTTHDDPLVNIGQQDITAHVNFSLVAALASDIGFNIAGYTNLAAFLINANILELAQSDDQVEQYMQNQQIKMLTMPSEMGEIFKVINLTKNTDITLSGFNQYDLRQHL